MIFSAILLLLSIQLDCAEFRIVKNSEWSKDSIYESDNGSLKVSVKPLQNKHNYLPQHSYKQNFIAPSIHTNFNAKLIDFKTKPSRLSWHTHDNRYFENQLSHLPPEIVFHKFNCYRYQGFQKYVETLSGFEQFILTLDKELHGKGALKNRMIEETNWEKSEEVLRYLNDKYHQIIRNQHVKQLNEFGFGNEAINLIGSKEVIYDFIYPTSGAQYNQLQKIASHTNKLAEFLHQESYTKLTPITNESTRFTLMSNSANKQNMVGTSQTLLQIAEDFLSLAKGVMKSCGRNALAVSEVLMDPIKAGKDIAHLIGNIGVGIGRVAETCTKFHTAIVINDNEMLTEASDEIDATCDQTCQLYKSIEQKYHDSSRAEVLELTGALATDAVLMMYAPKFQGAAFTGLKDTLPIGEALLATEYTFQKLGNAGKKIKQVAGLACAKGKRFISGAEATEELELALAGESKITFALEKEVSRAVGGSKKTRTTAELAKLTKFNKEIEKLSKKYGSKILADAKEALRVNEYKILKNGEKEFAKELEKICKDIRQIITSKPHRKNFIYDVDHNFRTTEGSILEGLTACAAEDQGFFSQLERSTERGVDFVDSLGKKWDIKSPRSKTIKHPLASFKKNKIVSEIISEMHKGENILIDITDITSKDYNSMITDLNNLNNYTDIIILHKDIPSKSFILFKEYK